jgi:cytochrome c556
MRISATVVVTTAALLVGAAVAHEGGTGVISERMSSMLHMEMKMRAIQGMLSGWATFDPAALRQNAVILRETCHHSESLFEGGHVERGSRARATVWEKPEAFDREFQKLHAAVEAFIETLDAGDRTDIAIAAHDLRQTCDGCHATFRKPEP